MTITLQIDQWDAKLRRMPIIDPYRVPGMGRSYPILGYENDSVTIRYFFHPADQVGANDLYLSSPLAVVFLTLDHFDVVYQANADDFFNIPKIEPHTITFNPQERDQRKARVAHLRSLYNPLVTRYPHQPAGELGQQFTEAFLAVAHERLLPYYKAVSPHFWAWLET